MNTTERCICTGLALAVGFGLAGTLNAQSNSIETKAPGLSAKANAGVNNINQGTINVQNVWWQSMTTGVEVWNNGGPDGANGLSHFEGDVAGGLDRVVADDFELTSNTDITWARMSGVWFAGGGAGESFGDFRIRVWADDGGQPGPVAAPVYDASSLDYTAEETGNVFFGRPEVLYCIDIDGLNLDAGTYWISLQPTGTSDNFFHLTSGTGADGTITLEQAHLQGDFDPFIAEFAPGDTVFGEEHDVTFVLGTGDSPCEEPPAPICPDLTGDGMVGPADLIFLVDCWGPVGAGCEDADINDDGQVNWFDLLMLLENWGCLVDGDDPEGCGADGTGDCCVANGSPYCNDADCCELICAADPFCCDTEWDGICASAAEDQCAVCDDNGPPPPDSDCCFANGTPGCDDADCEALICAQDPFCCETEWDGICAAAAEDQCAVCDGDGPPPPDSDCCFANGTPGCDDADCEALICAQDPFCCETEWDGICAAAAEDQCAVCDGDGPPPPDSNCCFANGTPGCDDADCEALICGFDPFCCDTEWDGICADQANDFCEVCDGDVEPELGACCDDAFGVPCANSTEAACTANGGTFQGVGTSCEDGDCDNGGPDGCGDEGAGDCCVANGSPFCNDADCCQLICAADPFCCDTEWDGICAGAAEDQCAVCDGNGPPPPDSDCCFANGTPGCDDADCEATVCAADPFCCDTEWDGICASAAEDLCGDLCF